MDISTPKIKTCILHLLVVSSLTVGVSPSRAFYNPQNYLEGCVVDLVLKAFGTLRGVGDVSTGSKTLQDFGSAASQIFGSDSYIPIIRESRQARELIPDNDGTGVSALLSMDCDHPLCMIAKGRQQCTDILGDDATHLKKLVLRRSPGYESPVTQVDSGDWLLECRRFLKVVLPEVAGGTPGRRTVDAADRGRLTSEATGSEASVKIENPKVTDLQTPSLKTSSTEQKAGSDDVEKKDEVVTLSAEECNKLFNTDPYTFHEECCLKASSDIHLRDHRCHLRQLLEKTQAKESGSSVESTDRNPVEFDEDISELGKTLDGEEVENRDGVVIEELTQQKEGWRHEYYVVLGFFLVFLAFFLIIVAVLVYKLKKNKTVTIAPSSPGVAPAGLNLTQQRARGYSAIEDDQGDRAALTPATEQAQAFQY